MNKRLGIFGLFLLMLFLSGCKHTEKVVIEKKLRPMSVKKIVRQVLDNELQFNTLSVKKVNLSIDNNGKTSSVRGLYKIKKDSIIQLSAQKLSFPVGKMEVDPDSFRLVYYIDKFVMSESIARLGEFIGYDLEFQSIQAILSNHLQSIKIDQKENQFKDYVVSVAENMYKISSLRERKFKRFLNNEGKYERFKQRKEEDHLVKQDIFVDPDIFVVRRLVYSDIDSGRIVTIDFSEFKPLANGWFPGNIVATLTGKERLKLEVELSKVSVNDETEFGFSIPSKYRRETLEKTGKE
ncbi:MAG: DUF4292 domain-containing protein [Marinilabiliales bacterium]|nr:DUF4292 domain-containing protein [Marinilabiliales bacterium]